MCIYTSFIYHNSFSKIKKQIFTFFLLLSSFIGWAQELSVSPFHEEVVDGKKCWVVQSTPKDRDEIYAYRITWIRQDCLMAVKSDFYDKLKKLHRRLTISNINKMQGFWTMHLMQMENVQTGHKTIIRMNNQRFNVKVAPNLFTISKQERGL